MEAEHATERASLLLTLGRAHANLNGAAQELAILRSSTLPKARRGFEVIESGYREGRFSLLELLDVQSSTAQAALREQEAILSWSGNLRGIRANVQ